MFLITYANDYWGSLDHQEIINLFNNSNWNYCISKETGHAVTDHEHYHLYLKYIGTNKSGFSTRNKNIWDLPLKIATANLLTKFNSEEWPVNKEGNKITMAHPNIKFKGDKTDENCKNTYKMLSYVVKQTKQLDESDWKIWSNFNWEEELLLLENKQKTCKKQQSKEKEFCSWLKEQVLTRPKATKNEIKRDIMKNDDYNYIYMSKYFNYNRLINDLFRSKPKSKPIPVWNIYYVPVELKIYLDKLDKWFEKWSKNQQPKGSRPSPLFLSGGGSCGKSSLISCMGTFSYWCNIWNMNNWEGEASFNFFDDYDGSEDYKGNQLSSNWTILKPWIGGQPSVTISGKYKEPETVDNDKPCIFVSNKRFEDRFPEEAREYFYEVGGTVVNLGKNKLYLKPSDNGIDTRTIGGFAGWVQYDTRKTYYYKNFINLNDKGKEEELNASDAEREFQNNKPVLIESEDELPRASSSLLGRPKKRTNPFEAYCKQTEKRNKKSAKDLF